MQIDWSKPLQTVRGWKVEKQCDTDLLNVHPEGGKAIELWYDDDLNGKYFADGLPHGDCPYDLINVPEPKPEPTPLELLTARVEALEKRLAEKPADDAPVADGVDWSKPLETSEGKAAEFLRMDNSPSFPRKVRVEGMPTELSYTERGTFYGTRTDHLDLRNVQPK